MEKGKNFYKKEGGFDKKDSTKDTKVSKDNLDDKYATKEDLAKANHRAKYSWMKDNEYALVERESQSTGKGFSKTLGENPIVKTYFETVDIKSRQTNAIGSPSNMVNQENEDDKMNQIEKDLSGNLPPGFEA